MRAVSSSSISPASSPTGYKAKAMGQIISLPEDVHLETRLLLPWYATGKIDGADKVIVETHLAECEACRAELESDRALRRKVEEVATEPAQSWDALAARLSAATPSAQALPPVAARRRSRRVWATVAGAAAKPSTLRWAVAAQLVLVVALGSMLAAKPEPRGEYRALGDAPAGRSANVLAMFKPETRLSDLQKLLETSGARLVDGPTSAAAYLLEVAGGADGPALGALRRDPHVTMAETIEQG